MDELLSERDKVNAHLKDVIDAPTEQPWGIRVDRVEVKDVSLPESMKRSMSRQAEAERERRARVISADGEYQASKKLAQAAAVMAAGPAALQLRLLQTVVEVAAEKNSTLVMPVPVELLRFFDRAAPAAVRGGLRPPTSGMGTASCLRSKRPQGLRSRCRSAWRPAQPGRASQSHSEDTSHRLNAAGVTGSRRTGVRAKCPEQRRSAGRLPRAAGPWGRPTGRAVR
jgi:hypothetical protein